MGLRPCWQCTGVPRWGKVHGQYRWVWRWGERWDDTPPTSATPLHLLHWRPDIPPSFHLPLSLGSLFLHPRPVPPSSPAPPCFPCCPLPPSPPPCALYPPCPVLLLGPWCPLPPTPSAIPFRPPLPFPPSHVVGPLCRALAPSPPPWCPSLPAPSRYPPQPSPPPRALCLLCPVGATSPWCPLPC